MSRTAAETVLAAIVGLCGEKGEWPAPCERPILENINTWIALREGDKGALKRVAGWREQHREYRVDALPERIADAWAHFLFGEEPTITPAAEADKDRLAALLDEDFASELERGAGLCVSEGEVWAHLYVDELVAPRPILDWVSRKDLVPYWVGTRLAGVALVKELPHPSDDKRLLRLLEVHVNGTVLNALYNGTPERLGEREADLAAYGIEVDEVWDHGLPGMLLFQIPNRLRRNKRLGISDYSGILDTLLDLNEVAAIGAHNMRLTARKRVVISSAATTASSPRDDLALTPEESPVGTAPPAARFDPSEEVFVEDPLDAELGRDSKDPYRIIEYSFDATALIEWKRDLVETALTRTGLSAQYVGATTGQEGYAISGTALRLRLIPTTSTGNGKARYWNTALPRILATMQALDALPAEQGGLGREWVDAATPPTVERRPGIPTDELEEASRHASLVGAGVESRYEAIRELHPDWDDTKVEDEVGRIKGDQPAGGSFMGITTGA